MTVGEILVKVGADTSGLMAGFSSAENRMEQFGTKMFYIGARITAGFSAPLAALSGSIAKFGMDFEKAMTSSLAIAENITPKIQEEMEGVARSIALTTKFSAAEAADGYYHLLSAGMDAAQSMQALPVAAQFAQAGLMDLAKSTEFLASATAALGLKSKDPVENMQGMARVADVLTEANNRALGTIEDFANALTNKAGASLRLVNKDVEEGVAVLAAYAERGIKGKTAGQQLWMMMRDLQVKAVDHAEAFRKAGIAVYDAAGNMRNMADIIRDFEIATKNATDAQKTQLFEMLNLPARSRAATMALVGFSSAIRDHENALRSAGGTTKEVAEKQMKSLAFQLDILKKRFVDVAIDIYKTFEPVIVQKVIPALEIVVAKIKDVSEWLKGTSTGWKEWALGITAVGIAIGPVLSGFGGLILVLSQMAKLATITTSTISGIATAFGSMNATVVPLVNNNNAFMNALAGTSRALMAVWDAVKFLVSPTGLSLTALAGVLYLVWPMFDELARAAGGWGNILTSLLGPVGMFTGDISKAGEQLKALGSIFVDTVAIIRDGYQALGMGITGLWDQLKEFASYVGGELSQSLKDSLKDAGFGDWVADNKKGAEESLSAFDAYMEGLRQDVTSGQDELASFKISFLQLYDMMKDESKKAAEKGTFGYVADKVHEAREWLHLMISDAQRNVILAKQLADQYKRAADNAKDVFAANRPKGLNGPAADSKQFHDDELLSQLSPELFAKAWKRRLEELRKDSGDFMPDLSKPTAAFESDAKKLQKRILELTNAMAGNSVEARALEAVFDQMKDKISPVSEAGEVLWEAYDKLRQKTGQVIPAMEEFFRTQITLKQNAIDLKYTFNDWGQVFSDAAVKFEDHAYEITMAWGDMDEAARKAFVKDHGKEIMEIADNMKAFSPTAQAAAADMLKFWASMDPAESHLAQMNKAREEIDNGLAAINATYQDKLRERDLFSMKWSKKELTNLRYSLDQQSAAYQKHFEKLLSDAAKLVGTPEFAEAWQKAFDFKETSDKVLKEMGRLNLLRIAQQVGVNAEILKNEKKLTDDEIAELIRRQEAWNLFLSRIQTAIGGLQSMGSIFSLFGNDNIAAGLNGIAQGVGNVVKGMDQWRSGNFAGQVAGVTNMVLGAVQAWKALSNVVGRANRAFTGAMAGMQIGSAFGPIGAGIGAGIGFIAGLIMKDPRWKRIQDSWSKKLGVALSEGTAKAIDQAAKDFGGDVEAAGIFNLDKIIADAGGIKSDTIDKWAGKLRDVFVFLERGIFSTAQAVEVLGKNFPAMAQAMLDSGRIASKQFQELITLSAQFGLNVKEITEFLESQAERFGTNFAKVITNASKAYDGLATKIADAKKKLDEALKKGSNSDIRKAQEELNKLLKEQAGLAAANATSIQGMGTIILSTFTAAIANGAGFMTTLTNMAPALDALIKAMDDLGITTDNAALKMLILQRQMALNNPALMEAVAGFEETLKAMSMIPGALNPESFAAMQQQLAGLFSQLEAEAIKAGGTSRDALFAILPSLQLLAQASKEYGFDLDDNTKKLIQMAKDQGIWTDAALTTNQVLALGFASILQAMGVDIPDALKKLAGMSTDTAGQVADDGRHAWEEGWDPDTYGMDGKWQGHFGRVTKWSDETGTHIVREGKLAAQGLEDALGNVDVPEIEVPYRYKQHGPGIPEGPDTPSPRDQAPPTALGGITMGPQVRLVGEAGPEAIVPLDELWRRLDRRTDVRTPEESRRAPDVTFNIYANDTKGVKEFIEREVKPELINMWKGNRAGFRTETRDVLNIKD